MQFCFSSNNDKGRQLRINLVLRARWKAHHVFKKRISTRKCICFIFERHALNTTESFLSLEVATNSPLLADFSFLSLFNAAYEY